MRNFETLDEHRAAVARRAYEIYLQRGAKHGNDVDDWLTAEKEILAKANREVPSEETPRARAAVATRIVEGSR